MAWTAYEASFQSQGDHLPVDPVHENELLVAPASRTGDRY
ncbi:Uncharacterized protein APZ42_030830 [Daphnia magna]|uniref:Uncharacterized protein n=1 Tax=Daphnia magna TaxID=35525 RepID=A0A162DCP3_9CRUS|nr:Uncharacterized protein APZ42_030830 [Daphnia magna]